jgi:hypothetical protein
MDNLEFKPKTNYRSGYQMRILNIVWAVAAIGFAIPAQAQDWDMVQSTQVAPEYAQPQFQSPINPASLSGYSVSNLGGIIPTTGTAQTALNSTGASGTTGNSSSPTGSIGILPNRVANPTLTQTSGMSQLPHAGTMGLAPVFGTGNDGFTSPGGYVPPMINIPGLGSYRIPSTIGVPGLSIQNPL